MGYAVVVGKGGSERCTLLLAEGSEVWIGERVVGFGEVVVALGVADAVDCCFAHCDVFVVELLL